MTDKNSHLADLADAVHRAERAYGEAMSAPAGAGRVEKINGTCRALDQAESEYQHCLDGRAYPLR